MKLTPTQIKIEQLKSRLTPNKEIARLMGISIKTVEFHLTNIKERRKTTNQSSALSGVFIGQWYLMPSKKFAQVMEVPEHLESVTVAIHTSIAKAQKMLDGSNQADLSRDFLKQNCQLWDAVYGKRAQA
jgi:DNA-binding CsgD family transcriptional regulator